MITQVVNLDFIWSVVVRGFQAAGVKGEKEEERVAVCSDIKTSNKIIEATETSIANAMQQTQKNLVFIKLQSYMR